MPCREGARISVGNKTYIIVSRDSRMLELDGFLVLMLHWIVYVRHTLNHASRLASSLELELEKWIYKVWLFLHSTEGKNGSMNVEGAT